MNDYRLNKIRMATNHEKDNMKVYNEQMYKFHVWLNARIITTHYCLNNKDAVIIE